MVFPLKTASNVKPGLGRWLPLAALALGVLACALNALPAADPAFTTSGLSPTPHTPTPLPSETALPLPSQTPSASLTPTPEPTVTFEAPWLYYAQAGDTLAVVAIRFNVEPAEITSPDSLPESQLLPPGQLLIIPRRLANTTSPIKSLPDSEIVYSPSAADFDIDTFVAGAGGYLSTYREYLNSTGWTNGAEIIERVAAENSINPRLLLALLEYQSGWVYGQPGNLMESDYPLGYVDLSRKGLYSQLAWAVNQLSVGYYGWREGLLTEIRFSDGVLARLAPDLNAGTVALQYYLSFAYDTQGWLQALDPKIGLPALHERMFGSPWLRAQNVEPIFPSTLRQPALTLPFTAGQLWSYTGGPHGPWEHDGARAALDFAPAGEVSGCSSTNAWVIASTGGIVARRAPGVVVLDLDGDGNEHTGWSLLYLHLHIEDAKMVVGKYVEAGEVLGKPSCEGGISTGTHVHIARKYNGEWIPADGPLPFNLSGWTPHAGENPYEGSLTRGSEVVLASVYGSFESRIIRDLDEP